MQLINPHNVRRHKGRKYSDLICTTKKKKKNSKLMMNHRRKIDELSSAPPLKFTEKNGFYYMLFHTISQNKVFYLC